MSTTSSQESHPAQEKVPLVEIELIPVEEDDLDTIAALEEVGRALLNEKATTEGYNIVEATHPEGTESEKTRGGVEFFQLVSGFVQSIHDQQDTLKILIGGGVAVLGLLLKQRRVKKLEVTVGKKTLYVEKADQKAVQTTMQQFEALCREEETNLTPSSKLKVKAHVSKKSSQKKNNKTKHKK